MGLMIWTGIVVAVGIVGFHWLTRKVMNEDIVDSADVFDSGRVDGAR